MQDAPRVEPRDRAQWRAWLAEHHADERGVWVAYARRDGDGLGYEDLVREALCFGWVDSTERRGESGRLVIYVAPRRRGSTWAASNKRRVAELLAAGLMAPAGIEAVERARADGSWTLLDAVEALQVPDDLALALAATPGARAAFEACSASVRKQALWWVVSAKRDETRRRRVAEVVRRAVEGALP